MAAAFSGVRGAEFRFIVGTASANQQNGPPNAVAMTGLVKLTPPRLALPRIVF